MKTRKSWRAKMDNPNLPKVVAIPLAWQKRFGPGAMLVPSPRDVDGAIRAIPSGQVATVSQVRRDLAARYAADMTCPLTTGIFIRIAAEAAEESLRDGIAEITPYWRVVKDDGSLNPKFPGGLQRQAKYLRAEGHRVSAAGGRTRVILPGGLP